MALVLVVDDTPVVRDLVRMALEDAGMSVEEAADGMAAMERLAQPEPCDAVVLDVMMPGASGHEVLQHLRASGSRTPVVMLSCKTEGADIEAAFHHGVADYVTKPFDPDHLVEAVRAALYGGSALGPSTARALIAGGGRAASR